MLWYLDVRIIHLQDDRRNILLRNAQGHCCCKLATVASSVATFLTVARRQLETMDSPLKSVSGETGVAVLSLQTLLLSLFILLISFFLLYRRGQCPPQPRVSHNLTHPGRRTFISSRMIAGPWNVTSVALRIEWKATLRLSLNNPVVAEVIDITFIFDRMPHEARFQCPCSHKSIKPRNVLIFLPSQKTARPASRSSSNSRQMSQHSQSV